MSDGEQFNELIVDLLRDVRSEQSRMNEIMDRRTAQVDEISRKIDSHAEESNRRHAQILNAFPASDIEGHRRYHQSVIEWREARNTLVKDCLTKAAQAGFVASTGWVLYAIWLLIKHELSR